MEYSFVKEMKQFGAAIKRLREMRGLTQVDVLKMTGIARSSLVAIEQGKRVPQGINIFRLCVAFKITPEQLMSLAFKEWRHPVNLTAYLPSKFLQKNSAATAKGREQCERRRKTTPKKDIFRR